MNDDLASAWANQGIAFLYAGGPANLRRAVDCVDHAIALRAPLLASGNPWFLYNLAGVWINRGDAQGRMADSNATGAALTSYDEALRLSSGLDLGLHAEFPRRVALAHLNRASAMLRLAGTPGSGEAIRSFDAAISTLGSTGDLMGQEELMIVASAWAGKADALGKSGEMDSSRSCAENARALVSPFESESRDAAIVGLKARIAICANSCRGLVRDGPELGEAIETAEDGLRLASRWGGDAAIQPLFRELFRFGTQAYAVHQPHFLGEFIREFMGPERPQDEDSLRRISNHALSLAIGRVAGTAISSVGKADLGESIETLGELRRAKEGLGSVPYFARH